MDERRVPNLEEMDELDAHRFLTDLYARHIPEEEYNVCHPEDYVMEMPESGERFSGRENMRSFQEAHPTPPSSVQVRRVLVKEGLWVVEGVINYGEAPVLLQARRHDLRAPHAQYHRLSSVFAINGCLALCLFTKPGDHCTTFLTIEVLPSNDTADARPRARCATVR